jgi:FAD/FMN-containing dehydrogenase
MTPDWGALQRAIDGYVVLPGSADYESVRKPVMARFEHLRPVAVVQCATPADIAATLAAVRGLRLPTAIRSGGHSVAGRSSTDGVVLDVTPMRSVVVAGDVATVGAGVQLGDLYDALAEDGLTIPAGCGPSVGIAGLTLGGGLGILGRKHGLTCDHLLRAQVVLADGRIVECDEHRHEELFWALRGAGGGHFGVVTSLVFRILPAPATTVFHLVWPPPAAAAVIQAWQAWAPDAPDELDATLRLTAAGDGERAPGVEVVGSVLDGEADAAELLGELVGGWAPTRWRRRAVMCLTVRPSGISRGSDQSRTASGWGRSGHLSRATSTPSRSSFADRCRTRRSQRWSSTLLKGWLPASRGRWTSCRGAAPITACPPTRPPSPTAANDSWSST